MHTKFLSENLKGKDHEEDLSIGEKMLEGILEKLDRKMLIGCIWLRIGTSGGFL
jgi:hypothetical protein